MIRLIAIIRGVEPEYIDPIAEALLENQINEIEVSLSEEESGLDCIRKLSENFKNTELHLGVGTVINTHQAELSLNAGAQYIIMPGWDASLVQWVLAKSVEVIPGVFSPSEVMQALNLNIKMVKLFPADFLGSDYIHSLNGPFPGMKYLAVGGVNLKTAESLLKGGFAGLGIGSSLVPRKATTADIDTITRNAREFRRIADQF
jgi:2-dehydro-3-deoxyphosphogluconate aldolase/(4S)-4-hydroxy-2-oxoglutarate aldolase